MAVINDYVNAAVAAGKLAPAAFVAGAQAVHVVALVSVAAADSDGSIYRLFKGLSGDLIPHRLVVSNDAITGGTDYDLGFYASSREGVTGAVISANCLADALDMSSAHTNILPVDGLKDVALADCQKKIYELAGQTIVTRKKEYDLCMTANTVGSAAGSIVVKGTFLLS